MSELKRHILLAYASQYGTTGETAEAIARTLRQAGATVDVKWINDVTDLKNYDAVIIGSAIQYDTWMPDARKFLTTHQDILSKLPAAYFFSCLTLSKRNEKTERQAMAYADKLYALHSLIKPVSVGRFAGVLDYSKMTFLPRLIFKGFSLITGVEEGDYRDWDGIRNWTVDVYSKFNQGKKTKK